MDFTAFIDDGQNRDGYVAAVPGLHGALGFVYRPALAEERFQFLRQQDADGRAYITRASKFADAHLVSWEAQDAKGAAVAKSPATIAKLHPNVLTKVLDQVLGYSGAEAGADAKNSSSGSASS